MFTWSSTLLRLYKDIQASRKLLPKKRVFILHATLLGLYFVLFAIQIVFTYLPLFIECDTSCKLKLVGVSYLIAIAKNGVEAMTFILVINLMCPLTNAQKLRRQELNKFLLSGFANFENLEQAVLEHNQEMDETELEIVKEEISRFKYFIDTTSET